MDPRLTTRPCWVEIDTQALAQNHRFLQQVAGPGVECLAVVKANAYGHGLELCAPALVRAGARWLGVTSVEEGVAARAVCPDARIFVMGGLFPGQAPAVFEHGLTPAVWEHWQLDELENYGRAEGKVAGSMPVHLEIDTGMSRQGALLESLEPLLARFTADSPLRLEAVMSHLYGSDAAQGESTPAQLARLDAALDRVQLTGSEQMTLSVGASASLLGDELTAIQTLAQKYNLHPMLRIGMALYGVVPRFAPDFAPGSAPAAVGSARENLRPVLRWKTRVASVRTVPAGTEVGYSGTFVATEPMCLALLAAGYADGLDRSLSNRFSLLVRGQRAPLVGRVSMDQAVVDVTEIPDAAPGDEVVIIGRQGGEEITAYDHAEAAGTIPWEVFTRIGARVARVRTSGE